MVRSLVNGDVKNGPIEMELVRVAQGGGAPAFYANPDGVYVVRPNLEVEIYVQIWTSNPTVTDPRLIVEWGDGEKDNIHCGPCRLTRTYRTEGRYTVKVTMDDRVGGVTSRTFVLEVGNPPPTGSSGPSGFGTFSGVLDAGDPTSIKRTSVFAPPATGLPCSLSALATSHDTYPIRHPGGPLRIETTLGTLNDSFIFLYSPSFDPTNACLNSVAADDDAGVGLGSLIQATFPAGDYVLVVSGFGPTDLGTYSLTIQ